MASRSGTRREPQIELRTLTDDYCEFVLKNTDVSMANALRRIILAEVRLAGAVAAGRRAPHRGRCRGLPCLNQTRRLPRRPMEGVRVLCGRQRRPPPLAPPPLPVRRAALPWRAHLACLLFCCLCRCPRLR